MPNIKIGTNYECLLISSSGEVFTIPAYTVEVDHRMSYIDVTRIDRVGRQFSPFIADPGEIRMKVTG